MQSNQTKVAELRTAFAFDCDDCGVENFVRAVVHEFSPEEQREMIIARGETPGTGDFVSIPESVTCKNCGAQFGTVHCDESD